MAVAISLEIQDYVLLSERKLDVSKQTVFQIRPLGGRERAKIQDKTRFSESSRVFEVKGKDGEARKITLPDNSSELAYETVLAGLAGWKNFKYASGAECPFMEDRERNLSYLEDSILTELYTAINELSTISEEQAGN